MNRPNNSDLNQPTTLNNVHGRPITTDEKAYRDGYVEGRTLQQNNQYQREKVAESNGIANGIIIGGILAAIVGLGAAAIAYYNRPQVPVQRSVIVEPTTAPSPQSSASPAAKQTTIIDRTIEKVTPAAPPEIKVIEVPKAVPVPVPVAPPAAPQSSQTTPRSSSSSSEGSPSSNTPSTNSTTTTPTDSSSPSN
ncbi:hypothetical protein [Alkalinema pantanalense]|uniref:hypothetical protein n=1 Tax=Alkalinema pantanalense TaxID=1620705 RepID=UPI003D6DC6F1